MTESGLQLALERCAPKSAALGIEQQVGRMATRIFEPFKDPTVGLDAEVNPFVAKLSEGVRDGTLPALLGPRLREMPGRWREEFRSRNPAFGHDFPLIVEVGCHKGYTLRQMAMAHPDKAFVGIDITFKRVVVTGERARDAGLKNVLVTMADARHLREYFGASEIDGLITFFPDPWPKRRQSKNRLFAEPYLRVAHEILRPNGFLWFKTDYRPYFDEGFEMAGRCGFRHDPAPTGLPAETYVTTFEKKATLAGIGSNSAVWRK